MLVQVFLITGFIYFLFKSALKLNSQLLSESTKIFARRSFK
jgi:hypothetical protein